MRRRTTQVTLAVLLIGAVALVLPWLSRERTWRTSTPVPPGLLFETSVSVEPGQRACTSPVVVEPRTGRVVLGNRSRDAPPLSVTLSGPDYVTRAKVPAQAPRGELAVPIAPPPHAVAATLCIVNTGRRSAALAAVVEPRRASTSIDGRPAFVELEGHRLRATVEATLQEARKRTIASGAWEMIGRMTAFRPGFVAPGLVAVLLGLLVVLAAAGAPWAYARALAGDEERRRSTE